MYILFHLQLIYYNFADNCYLTCILMSFYLHQNNKNENKYYSNLYILQKNFIQIIILTFNAIMFFFTTGFITTFAS